MSDKNFSKNINIRKVVVNEKFHLMFAKFEIYFKDKRSFEMDNYKIETHSIQEFDSTLAE